MLKINIMAKETKTILITGASSGIGRETAICLAKQGHKVFAGVRRKIDKHEIENLGLGITGVYLDVTNASSIDKAFWFIIKHADKIDVLINNAGIAIGGPMEFISVKQVKEQFEVNVFGALSVAQKFFPFLKNGLIINISSLSSYGLFPYIAPYCASKKALDVLFNNLMLENKDNIQVVSVRPSVIKTPIWNKSIKKAQDNLCGINEALKNKYKKEIEYLSLSAERSIKTGLAPSAVTDTIINIINSKNPKPIYNIGWKSVAADWISRLPQAIINLLIKTKLNSIK